MDVVPLLGQNGRKHRAGSSMQKRKHQIEPRFKSFDGKHLPVLV